MTMEDLLAGTLIEFRAVGVLGKSHYNSVAKLREIFHLALIFFNPTGFRLQFWPIIFKNACQ